MLASVAGACFVVLLESRAGAQPLRLRADAAAEARAPAGLVVLQGADKATPWFDAEGLVWAGSHALGPGSSYASGPFGHAGDPSFDVMVLSFRAREPHGLGEVRGGRFVFATGAIRPVQVDGASALARTPSGTSVEAMAGAPVVPSFGARAYDWIAAGRVAQRFDTVAVLGASYVQRRAHGEIANEDLGADVAFMPVRNFDLSARAAYDLSSPGVADAMGSAAWRVDAVRLELFASHRSPSRLLPATSLFSVLGDFPSDMIGSTIKWSAAPRLDVLASGAGQDVAGSLGGNAWLRALLRLDDRGDGDLGVELRRQDVSTARWTGVRFIGTQPIGRHVRFSSELEIAAPDAPNGRGVVWPWGLMAVSWRSGGGWEVASAVEAASTPEHRFEVDALVRLSRVMELSP